MDPIFQIESKETFAQVMNDILDNLFVSDTISNETLDPVIVKLAIEQLRDILVDGNFNPNEINELLSPKGYDNDKLITFYSMLENKKSELIKLAEVHYNSALGETLNSFDWKLKLISGTSDYKIFTYPLLEIVLDSVTQDQEPIRRLQELDKGILGRVIKDIEEVLREEVVDESIEMDDNE